MDNVSISNITLSTIVSVAVSIASYSASASYTDVVYSTDSALVSYDYELVETRPLPAVSVSISELISNQVNKNPSDDITITETETKTIGINSSDLIEASDQVNTVTIGKNPSDTATMAESTAKNITHGGFSDTASIAELISNQANKSPSDSLTAAESISLSPSIPLGHAITASESVSLDSRPAFSHSASVTDGDEDNAGLLVNFMYTDTQDPEIGGHKFNETPLCAGAY